ncbi:MAG TPA: ribosome biogenesis GTPase Der [Myxococcota bacterium]|nr:ribosome biogenesis GTPase Der [Myxococcota bacterium]
MSREPRLPIVAIVGRPNVGKSTLFNRYAGARRALVEDEPGITRDRIASEIEVGSRRVLIVDTAGLDGEAEGDLYEAVQQQAWSAIEEADAILFLVDGKAGLLPEDESLARTLRQTAKPVLLAVNKIDLPQHEARIGEFYRLGFESMRGLSAEHATGAWDALEALVAQIPETIAPEPVRDEGIRIAIVGRPNVGKSSLANRIAGEPRVVVSEVPGTTRDAIDIAIERDGQRFTLIDTAGLRRQGRRTRSAERGSALMTVRALERAQVAFVVVDAGEGFRAQDATIASLAQERGCATAILANKWDLLEKGAPGRAKEVRESIAHGLRFLPNAPFHPVSAKTGAGVEKILECARSLRETAERRIPTAELNRWLQECVERHEPAMAQRGVRKRPLKFFYATQTSVRPPTFVLVCTDPDAVQLSYRRFLENRLRERFGFAGVPIRLRLRARSRSEDRE